MYGVLAIRLIVATGVNRSSRPRPWVARITGTHSHYGLAREFMKPVYDYSRASRKGKDTYAYFNLPPGLYEVYHPTSWKHETRYFAQVDEHGDIHEVSKEVVLECLKNDI